MRKYSFYGKNVGINIYSMVRKHTIKKERETNYNAKTGDVTITETEEHVIIEKHEFMNADENEDEEDLMFLGKKKGADDDEEEPVLVIFNDDDKFW